MDEQLTTPRDSAGVFVPPPAIPLAVLIVGLALDRLSPVGVTGAVFSRPARLTIAAALIMAAAWAIGRSLWRFRRAGTPPEPWKTTTALVTRGIYRRTRNPIYQGFALFVLGVAFATTSDWIFLVLPFGALAMHLGVVRREERYLARKFGEDYRRYCETVPRYGWPV
jgi:protein-S-isoprenylcysteine O-methyltransferase Ste14